MSEPITLDDPSAYFDRLADFDTQHWWPRVMRTIAAGRLDACLKGLRGLSALDVGCGTGSMLGLLAARPSIARVVGLEPSGEALRRLTVPGVPTTQGSATYLPFPDASFDVVTCMDVLQHLTPSGSVAAVLEFARVLRPGGVLLVRTNAGGRSGYRRSSLEKQIAQGGFHLVWISHVNCLPALAQELKGRLTRSSRSHPEGGGLPTVTPDRFGSRLMGRVAAIEALAPARLGWRLPFGHGLMCLARRL